VKLSYVTVMLLLARGGEQGLSSGSADPDEF
jgi:hypothetical protein